MKHESDYAELLKIRFWLIGACGGVCAAFGILANAFLTKLFVSRLTFRHSPFFFLGFVALFDTLLDAVYIFVLTLPISSRYLAIYWLSPSSNKLRWLYLLGQIFKMSSVFCLVVASFERYLVTSHWTFSGFEQRTRWIVLAALIFIAVIIRLFISIENAVSHNYGINHPYYGQQRYVQHHSNEGIKSFLDLLTICLPFGTLVFLNVGIVFMVRRQNVQQLRSLLTELTMGPDFTKIRRRNIRAATNTLLLIISIYLISNLLSLFLSISEYINPGYIERNYPFHFYLGSDCASLLTVFGNALRFPAHYFSNAEVRLEVYSQHLCCLPKNKLALPPSVDRLKRIRRYSENNPWFSAIVTTSRLTEEMNLTVNGSNSSSSKGGIHNREEAARLYLNGNNGNKIDNNKEGKCGSCGASYWECCCDGLLVTGRESLYEDYFTEETLRITSASYKKIAHCKLYRSNQKLPTYALVKFSFLHNCNYNIHLVSQ